MSDNILKSTAEIAADYNVQRQTVLEWYHNGIIPAKVAVGKTFRFDPSAVAKALEKHAAKHQGSRQSNTMRGGAIVI